MTYQSIETNNYPNLSAQIDTLGEPITPNVINNAKLSIKIARYRKLSYPLGKSIKGLKKWLKRNYEQ